MTKRKRRVATLTIDGKRAKEKLTNNRAE